MYLANSPQRRLPIEKSFDVPPHSGRYPINSLPLELLTQILHHVATLQKADNETNETFQCHQAQYVCKRWQQAYERVFYRAVKFDERLEGLTEHDWFQYLQRLRQAFSRYPRLGGYVRDFSIDIW